MKICHITTVHPPFDIRIFHKEAKTVACSGFDVILIAQNDRDKKVGGVNIIGLPRARNRFHRIFVLTWRAFYLALKQKGSVYHFHDPEFLPWGWLLQKITRKPVIYDVHEYYALDILTKEWIPYVFRYLISKSIHKIEKIIARKLGGIATVNHHMEGLFKKVNCNTITIHNYPSLRFVDTMNAAGKPELFTIIHIGTTSRMHGYQNMIEAMGIVRNKNPKVRFVVVGQVDRKEIPQNILMLEDNLVRDKIINLIGRVPYDEIPQFLSRAMIAWIPWLAVPNNVRGTPTKLFEYMAAGLPVVASKIGILNEIIEGNGCGVLVDPNDPNPHSEAILHLLHHPEEAKRMGHNGRKAILEKYNWEEESKKLLDFYSKLVTSVTS